MNQASIGKVISVSGIGLHKGNGSKVEFSPAEPDSGIIIRNKGETYKLDVKYVSSTNRGTVLKRGKSTLHTVEHMLSAIKALGIDNIIISVEGDEAPVLDGSSSGFIAAFKNAEVIKQKPEKKAFKIKEPYLLGRDGKYLVVLPGEGFTVRYFSDFSRHGIAAEEAGLEVTPEAYEREISKARTFGFKSELNWLMKAGLARGGTLDNAIVIENGKPVKGRLRYANELTRHKVLDIIGDFAFIEGRLNMTVIAYKTGHGQNIEMVKKLLKSDNNF